MSTQIKGLFTLLVLSLGKKSVIVPGHRIWGKPRPAAFVINLPGHTLVRLFSKGMYVYERKIK